MDVNKNKRQHLQSALPQIWEILRTQRIRIAVGLVLLVINRISGLAAPYAPKLLLDRVIAKRDLHFLVLLVACLVLATLIQASTSFALGQVMAKETDRLIARMRCRVQAHISRLPVSYYDANQTGALASRIMTDVNGLGNLVGRGLVEFAGGIFTTCFVLIILVHITPLITSIAITFLLIFAFCWKQTFKTLRPLVRQRAVINAEVTGRLTESLSGVRVVKGYQAEEREETVFRFGVEKLLEKSLQYVTASNWLELVSAIDLGLLGASVLGCGALLIVHGRITVGDLFSYMMFMVYVSGPIIQLTAIGPDIAEALASLDRTRQVLSEHQEDEDPERKIVLPHVEGHLRFDHVDFEYDIGRPVLTDINFESSPGSITALVGSSGSGKSTITGLVAAFYRPTRGTVFIDGVDLNLVRLDCYRSILGVVLQEPFLFSGTIRENVIFALPDATEEEVQRACHIAHVDEFVERFKDSYETMIGERGVKLSGGQRQRVSIARAILADPRILILDEATSSLDSESELFIQQGLKYLMKGRTTLVIAHRLSTIRKADQILVIESGSIVERGTHASLQAQCGRYCDLYNKQYGLESGLLLGSH